MPSVEIATRVLRSRRVGTPVRRGITGIFNGCAFTKWELSEGELPPGLTLDPEKGVITGIPETKGSYEFSITLTGKDKKGNLYTDTKSYLLIVFSPASAGGDGSGSGGNSSTGGDGSIIINEDGIATDNEAGEMFDEIFGPNTPPPASDD